MNESRTFSSENLLISVVGHLFLVALMITSFVIVVERATNVTPDRIEIMEIDLGAIKVSVDETRLYNTDVPKQDVSQQSQKDESVKSEPVPIPDEKTIETPSMVEYTPKPQESKKDVPAQTKEVEPVPVPKKKTVVRVNRQVMSLDRTMTISVLDALRVAMTRCWTIDTRRPDIADIRAVAHLSMRPNGTVRDVWFESASRADTDPGFAYVLDTIRNAINVCQPFKMLPPNEYEGKDGWREIQLTFYPNSGQVM